MEAKVLNIQGTETGRTVTLSDAVFGLESPSRHAIYMDVRQILANARQGTHKTKERGEVSGSTKKAFRQKGTGGARRGHRRSPLLYHGGTIFGPKPRDYSFKVNSKIKALARRSALTFKAQGNAITVLESFSFDAPKTKRFLEILEKLSVGTSKVLVVLPEQNANVFLSGRNLPNAHVCTVSDLNTYDILNAERMVIVENAVNLINQRLS
jgi:large subunit ribosomal protein L4